MSGGGGGKTPDYVGAAQAQGQANIEAAIATGLMNNPNVNNPYGTQEVTWQYEYEDELDKDGKKTGKKLIKKAIPTITQKLSAEQQGLYDQGIAAKGNLGRAGIAASNNAADMLSKGLDLSGLPNAPKSAGQRREDVIAAMMTRVNEDTGRQRDSTRSDLIAAGIRPGTRAYSDAMNQIDRQFNDARGNAILAGGQEATRDFGMDTQARQTALAEMLTQRQTPLNEVNAIMSGTQINNPFAGGLGFQGGMQVQPAPIAQAITNQGMAQQNQANLRQAQQNANINAGAGLIGSAISAYKW